MSSDIKLHIIPNKITENEWRRVYQETIELLKAYKFATVIFEDRCILDKVEYDSIMWEVSGDLQSREYGDTFCLKSDIEQYRCFVREEVEIRDILETAIDREGAALVFEGQTYSKKYHKYLLAIVCLIESRLPKYAMVSGDISKEQSLEAIEWANSILDKKIDIPVRVHKERLLKRIRDLYDTDIFLKFRTLKIGVLNPGLKDFIKKEFTKEELDSYFYSEIEKSNGFDGDALKLVVDYFRFGYKLREIVKLLKEVKISDRDILNGICDSWLFIEKKDRKFMEFYRGEDIKSARLDIQMSISLNQKMNYGLFNDDYISEEVGIKILKEELEVENIEAIIMSKNRDIREFLKEKEEEYIYDTKLQEKSSAYLSVLEAISLYDMNEDISVKEELLEIVKLLKEKLNEKTEIKNYKEEIIKAARKEQIILTREAWSYIDNISDRLEMRVMLEFLNLSEIENIKEVKTVILENKKFYEENILNKLK